MTRKKRQYVQAFRKETACHCAKEDRPNICEYCVSKVKLASVSIIVQQDATIYSFIIFLQTALHVSGGNLTHHQ